MSSLGSWLKSCHLPTSQVLGRMLHMSFLFQNSFMPLHSSTSIFVKDAVFVLDSFIIWCIHYTPMKHGFLGRSTNVTIITSSLQTNNRIPIFWSSGWIGVIHGNFATGFCSSFIGLRLYILFAVVEWRTHKICTRVTKKVAFLAFCMVTSVPLPHGAFSYIFVVLAIYISYKRGTF